MRLSWWLTFRRGGSSVILFEGNTSGNSEMKSGGSVIAMAENRMLLAFLHDRVTFFSVKVIIAFYN